MFNRRYKVLNKKNKYYIYKFLDINDNVIYVGQTTNMEKRMYQHKKYNYRNFELYSNIYKIRYAEVESDYHMNIYEIHYICKYNSKYNTEFKTNNKRLFDIPEVEWKLYILKKFIENCYTHYIIATGDISIDKRDFKNSNYFQLQCIPEYEQNKKIIDDYFKEYNIKYINDVNEYFNPYIDDYFLNTYDSHFAN
jgi:predicted GIY-YIG superfamily endonuclease